MVWFKFIACVIIIVFAGRYVAKYGDALAEKTGLGRAWIGVVLIAITTSLPELFVGISAVTLADVPNITIGNLFGANTFNLLNLALLDIMYRERPLLTVSSMTHLVPAGLSLILVAFAAASLFLSQTFPNLGIGGVGIYTPVILLLYLASVRMIFNYEKRLGADLGEHIVATAQYEHISLRQICLYYSIAALFIIGAGIWLAFVGKEIAEGTGWEQSFVGSLFIALTTTLPEITVSFVALRMGAVDMAVGNMIGSNLFNMTIIAIVDLFYRKAPILSAVSSAHLLTALVVVLMTGIFIVGLIDRPKQKTALGASWYAIALIAAFLIGTYINFIISS